MPVYEYRALDRAGKNKDGIINVNKGNTDYISEYNLDILSEKAARNGLAAPIVQNELSLAILGREAAVIRNGDKEIPVIVTGDGAKDKIGEVPLRAASGEYINRHINCTAGQR